MGSSWTEGAPNTGFANWDTFLSTSFNNETPGSSFGISNASLSQTSPFTVFNQGGGLYNVATSTSTPSNGDVLFAGGNTLNFILSGNVQFTIYGLVLQIKRPGSTGTLADSNGFSPTLSIGGGPALTADQITTTFGSGDTSSTAGTYSVTTWYWDTSLASQANTGSDAFSLSFSKTASQRLIDDIQVDIGNTAVVPEPSAYLFVIGALGAAIGLRRHRPARLSPLS